MKIISWSSLLLCLLDVYPRVLIKKFLIQSLVGLLVGCQLLCIKCRNQSFFQSVVGFQVKLVIVIKGDPKASFSIATTPRCREVPLLSLDCSTLPLIRTLYRWVLIKKVSSITLSIFAMTRPEIELRFVRPLAKTWPVLMQIICIDLYDVK